MVGFLMMIVDFGFGKPDSGLQLLGFLGVYVCIAGIFFLVIKGKKENKNNKRRYGVFSFFVMYIVLYQKEKIIKKIAKCCKCN